MATLLQDRNTQVMENIVRIVNQCLVLFDFCRRFEIDDHNYFFPNQLLWRIMQSNTRNNCPFFKPKIDKKF